MSGELLKFKGRLEEARLLRKELHMKIDGQVKAMRENLDPFEDVADLPADIIAQQARELAQLRVNYIEVSDKIRAIEKALGR